MYHERLERWASEAVARQPDDVRRLIGEYETRLRC